MTGAGPAQARLDQAVSNPVVATVVNLVEQAGIPISREKVRRDFAALDAFPALRLAEVQEMFDSWSIPNTAFRTEASALRDIPLPVIAVLDEKGREPARQLAVIRAWRDDAVDLLHPMKGATHLPWPLFLEQWTGVMFAAVADGAAGEADFAEKSAREAEAANAYRHSILRFEDFLPIPDCAAIIAYCEERALFARSPIESLGDRERLQRTSSMRTSHSAILSRRDDPLLASLYARVSTGLGAAPDRIEDIQCVRYDPGQEFLVHVDGRDRRQTMLLYLNEDFEGGETLFPDIDLAIAPRAGLAVAFRNLDPDGRIIPWSRHAGLPPRSGRKYACNIWIS